MIKLRNKETKSEFTFDITKFPDGTSQVWHINPEPEQYENLEVLWMFENEVELFHIHQLGLLLSSQYKIFPTLNVPYLPYGRQDKEISNTSTFARHAFISLVKDAGYTRIVTYDAHSSHIMIESKEPVELIEAALPGHDVVCFPDAGAVKRYMHLIPENTPTVFCEKKRNQQTGEIKGLKLINEDNVNLEAKKILVLDDICDGGRTFIEVAKAIRNLEPKSPQYRFCMATGPVYISPELSLAVSHGIFSKGLDIIYNSGYNTIYTTNSNIWMYKNNNEFCKKYIPYLNIIEVVK